jgi:DNA-binding Lrp family transcriptional regulator
MSTEDPSGGSDAGQLAGPVDRTDRAIIAALTADGRIAVRALAEKIHISRANAYGRIARMMATGVIAGFTARLDPAKAGLGTTAYVSLTIEQNAWRAVLERLREIPYVDHIALVGGDYDVLVLVRAPDNAVLRQVVLERIQGISSVRSTRTWLVFEEAAGAGADWE